MNLRVVTPALILVISCVTTFPAYAQTVKGFVKDMATNTPIADASVVLLDDRGRVQRGTLSEPDGSFVLVAPKSGKYQLRVGAAGYVTKNSTELELADDQLEEIDVLLVSETESGPPGFDTRRRLGKGIFLTPADWDKHGSTRFTDVFRFTPGVTVVPMGGSYSTIRIKPDRGTAGVRHVMEEGGACVPVLFVDGTWWGPIDEASGTGPDQVLLPADLVAIEIYNHPSVLPDQFDSGRDAQNCGVVVVWRKQ